MPATTKSVRDEDLPMIGGSFPCRLLQAVKIGLFAVMPLWALAAIPVEAATFTVNSTADTALSAGMCVNTAPCTLRAAIQLANATPSTATSPNTITLPSGTYALTLTGVNEDQAATGDLDITANSNIVITGAGSSNTIIDGYASDRVFQVMNGAALSITGVTIQNGRVSGGIGGGIYNSGGTVSLDSSSVINNKVDNSGAGGSGGNGGGIYNGGALTITGGLVQGNIADTTVSGGGGGGIYNAGTLTVTNTTLDSNQVTNGTAGGGGALLDVGVAGIGSSTVTATITGSTLSNNAAPLGAAISDEFGRVIVDTSVIENNTAGLSGGGIYNTGGNDTVSRTAILNNTAPQNGGGVANLGTMDIGNSSIYGNTAPGCTGTSGCPIGTGGSGGGVFNSGGGNLNIFNATLTGNSARIGGGLYNHNEVLVTNSSLFDNSATSTILPNGSEVYACGNPDNSVTPPLTCANGTTGPNAINQNAVLLHTKFVNTIVGDSNGDSPGGNCYGVNLTKSAADAVDPTLFSNSIVSLISSNGHNLETADTCGFHAGGDLINQSAAALFSGPFSYNGGARAELDTFPLALSSPAHNAGDIASCPLTDERGFKRDEGDGLCDIGAYEISKTYTGNAVLDLALSIQYKNAAPQNGAVQTTTVLSVANKGPLQATGVVLTVQIPTALSWLKIVNVGSSSGRGICNINSTGFVCTVPSIDAYKSEDFFVATLATQLGSFQIIGDAESSEPDNFPVDNHALATVTISNVSGSTASGNNFGTGSAGYGGAGGAMDGLTLAALALLLPALRRVRRR